MVGNGRKASLVENVLAQAAAVITLLVALVYACGAIELFIRLWLRRLPASAVLGQLPRDLLFTLGLPEVLLPAVAGGALLSLWVQEKVFEEKPKRSRRTSNGDDQPETKQGLSFRWTFFGSLVVSGIVTGLASLAYEWAYRRRLLNGVLRTRVSFIPPVFVATAILLGVAAWISLRASVHWGRNRGVVAAVFTLALIPGVAAISAASSQPDYYVCGIKGLKPPGVVEGDLIGTTGGYSYVAQYEHIKHKRGPDTVGARWIAIVPQSQARITTLAIGGAARVPCTQ